MQSKVKCQPESHTRRQQFGSTLGSTQTKLNFTWEFVGPNQMQK